MTNPDPVVTSNSEEPEVDFELVTSEDHKQATITLKSPVPLTSEDLVYVIEAWAGSMKEKLKEVQE